MPLHHLPSVTDIRYGLFCFPSPLQSPAQDTKTAAFLLLFSHSVVSDSLQPHGLQHARIFCPSPSLGACSNSCPLSQICHPTISILCCPLSLRVYSDESTVRIRWPKYWSFSISPSSVYSGLVSFRIEWFDLLAVQGTLESLLQHCSSKASILQCSTFFVVRL